LALYQVHRAQPLKILIVTAIVGLMSYFLVTVIPGRAIGADLLHLKDVVCPENAHIPLRIAGAGLNDGSAQCGLSALIIAEWLPATIVWLSAYFR
jgi:uncharacterized membrane protein